MTRPAAAPRIAFVVPRFGERVVGGAETLARLLAERLVQGGRPVDVLTTCSVDHFTWRNTLSAGFTVEAGVGVHRFPVGDRNARAHSYLHATISRGVPLSYGDQVEWMASSVWSPDLLAAAHRYEWLITLPYLFGTTFWTCVALPERTIVMPCLHDEQHARQGVMLDMLASARGIMANAPGEKRLIDRLLCEHTGGRHSPGTPQTVIVGAGFDDVPIPKPESVERFCAARGLTLGYLLYAGRREEAKGLPELFDCYRRFRDHYPDGPPLVLMGSGDLPIPPDLQPHAVDLGFVDLRDRELVYAGASVLLQPSRLESFGMVLFESWLAGTPVLVNGAGEVLRDHVEQSAGGLTYLGEGEFTQALAMLVDDPGLREQMAAAGRGYTLQEFGWDPVIQRFEDALARWS